MMARILLEKNVVLLNAQIDYMTASVLCTNILKEGLRVEHPRVTHKGGEAILLRSRSIAR